MVANAKAEDLNFQWVMADGFYGRDSHFRHTLRDMNLTYMVDIPMDMTIYFEDPKPFIPPKSSKKGRTPMRLKASTEGMRLDKWLEQQPDLSLPANHCAKFSKGVLDSPILT